MADPLPAPRRIRIAHSPDSDDAFMFYALTHGRLDTSGLEIEHSLQDIESLNQAAFDGRYEITALSFHAYAHLADRYDLMPSGASFGDGYGPVVVTREPRRREELRGRRIAIPGRADHLRTSRCASGCASSRRCPSPSIASSTRWRAGRSTGEW